MKKYFLFIALAMVAGLTISCKNNKTTEDADAAEVAKTVISDDVIATLDEIAQTYINAEGIIDIVDIISSNLTDEEKLVKPDYLLDPNQVKDLLTKEQKIGALAILLPENALRKAYGMPTEEAEEVAHHLMADINFPLSIEDEENLTIAEKVNKVYADCRERGELAFFWLFTFSMQQELSMLIALNPDVFFRAVSQEQLVSCYNRFLTCLKAMEELAPYDEEIAMAYNTFSEYADKSLLEEPVENLTKEQAKQNFADSKDDIVYLRNEVVK